MATLQETKDLVDSWLATIYTKVKNRQDWYFARYGRYFQLPRLPWFPANDGAAGDVPAEDLDREADNVDHRWPNEPGEPFATPATYDPATGLVTSPGTLDPAWDWEVEPAPKSGAGGTYYEPAGTVARRPAVVATWRKVYAQIGETIPSQLTFSVQVGVVQGGGNWGWYMHAEVLWESRSKRWSRRKGEGHQSQQNTWDWREESIGGEP